MNHPRLRSIHSPLTPIPPMSSQTSFDFSPSAINRCLEASKSTTPSVLKSRRTFTPLSSNFSPPDLSPIEFLSNSAHRNVVSPNTSNNSNSSFSKANESVSFDAESSEQKLLSASNINNHHMDMSTILADIGLKQYKSLFEVEEIDLIAFLLLTDDDLQEIGVKDGNHRKTFTGMIDEMNSLINLN